MYLVPDSRINAPKLGHPPAGKPQGAELRQEKQNSKWKIEKSKEKT